MLKLKFPVNIENTKSYYSIPFGHIERTPNGHENPGGPYLAAHGKFPNGREGGMVLLNDCKYSFDVHDNVMAMTVLRSPVYAHHRPYELKQDIEYPYMDQGIHEFKYALAPFVGEWIPSKSMKAADLLNVPLIPLQEFTHSGTLQQESSFITINADNIILTAMKQHEDSEDIIVRIHEADGKSTAASVSIPSMHKSWKGMMKPYEIKTLRLPKGKEESYEIDFIEWDKMQ